ncbi:NAD(P)/FAD-dependent oxidoreductase [Halotalea alkalilenta]|uniref:Oxidoreductase n=1 Tax=Halotalea alkalilenta TaxID=376489 RepID=A0A172YIZ4_9GAMM|nr:FAD-binding oxidoreductase [Halotalea alkalilenta]ANF59169.1 oxidoreductase [Halotalea alkalilenta]
MKDNDRFGINNLYRQTAIAPPESPQLSQDVSADVVIVGGGYTGLSTALHLAEAGLSCVLLEAHDIGHGCSGRNGGQVNPGLKWAPDQVERDFGPELGKRMVELSYAAPAEVFDLIEKHQIDCAPRRTGTIRAAIDSAGLRDIQTLSAQCIRRNMPVELVSAEGMRKLTGTERYLGGMLDHRGGHINPLGYARGLAHAAILAGARLHGQSAALSIERQGAGWVVRTAKASVKAARVVVGTNGYTGDLWPKLKRTIAPIYTYVTASEPLPDEILRTLMPSGAALYESAWDVVYYRVDDGGRLVMGGRGPQRDATSLDDYAHLIRYAKRLWPQLEGVSWPWHWYGQVAITEDHYPHWTEPEPDADLMLGYNGRGIAMATVAGRLISRRIVSNGSDEQDFPIRTRLKPMPFQPFWRVGAEARMLLGRAGDLFKH